MVCVCVCTFYIMQRVKSKCTIQNSFQITDHSSLSRLLPLCGSSRPARRISSVVALDAWVVKLTSLLSMSTLYRSQKQIPIYALCHARETIESLNAKTRNNALPMVEGRLPAPQPVSGTKLNLSQSSTRRIAEHCGSDWMKGMLPKSSTCLPNFRRAKGSLPKIPHLLLQCLWPGPAHTTLPTVIQASRTDGA